MDKLLNDYDHLNNLNLLFSPDSAADRRRRGAGLASLLVDRGPRDLHRAQGATHNGAESIQFEERSDQRVKVAT